MKPLILVYVMALVGLVFPFQDVTFEDRKGSAPIVEVSASGGRVVFNGLHYRTSIYGNKSEKNDGEMVEAFLGIPYAEAPVGANRFKTVSLKKVSELNETFDANQWKPGCMQQFGMFTEETSEFSEDCLFLNIWRKKGTKSGDNKPVIVIIHGGGYSAGDGHELDWRGPQLSYFGDVVVVNFNYRLGIFGFLDLDIDGARGHQGHIDQVTLLNWVKLYVKDFGGDPNRVTLFGVSAGSFSISWHLMIGLSNGLFHSAVMDAGVLSFNNAETSQHHVNRSLLIAQDYGCIDNATSEQETPNEILKCLLTIPEETLVELQQRYAVSQTYTYRPTYFNDKYFPNSPECIINEARFRIRVPIIIGDTTNEGLFLLTHKTSDEKPTFNSTEEVIAWDIDILKGHHTAQIPIYGKKNSTIKYWYGLNKKNLDPKQLQNAASQIIGDGIFVCPVMNFANQYSSVQKHTYYYWWNRTRLSETFEGEKTYGAYHGLSFYTGAGGEYLYLNGSMADADKTFIKSTIAMITKFAANPLKPPQFEGSSLVMRRSSFFYNEFYNEGMQKRLIHPKSGVCSDVWRAYSSRKCSNV